MLSGIFLDDATGIPLLKKNKITDYISVLLADLYLPELLFTAVMLFPHH